MTVPLEEALSLSIVTTEKHETIFESAIRPIGSGVNHVAVPSRITGLAYVVSRGTVLSSVEVTMSTKELATKASIETKNAIVHVACNADGRLVAVACTDGSLYCYDVTTNHGFHQRWMIKGVHTHVMEHIDDCSSESRQYAAGGAGPVRSLAFSSTNCLLLADSKACLLKVYDATSSNPTDLSTTLNHIQASSASWSPDGNAIAIGDVHGSLHLYSMSSRTTFTLQAVLPCPIKEDTGYSCTHLHWCTSSDMSVGFCKTTIDDEEPTEECDDAATHEANLFMANLDSFSITHWIELGDVVAFFTVPKYGRHVFYTSLVTCAKGDTLLMLVSINVGTHVAVIIKEGNKDWYVAELQEGSTATTPTNDDDEYAYPLGMAVVQVNAKDQGLLLPTTDGTLSLFALSNSYDGDFFSLRNATPAGFSGVGNTHVTMTATSSTATAVAAVEVPPLVEELTSSQAPSALPNLSGSSATTTFGAALFSDHPAPTFGSNLIPIGSDISTFGGGTTKPPVGKTTLPFSFGFTSTLSPFPVPASATLLPSSVLGGGNTFGSGTNAPIFGASTTFGNTRFGRNPIHPTSDISEVATSTSPFDAFSKPHPDPSNALVPSMAKPLFGNAVEPKKDGPSTSIPAASGGYPPVSSTAPKNPFSKGLVEIVNPSREKLVALFQKYNPGKLGDVDILLEKYKGRDATLFKKIEDKYMPTPCMPQVKDKEETYVYKTKLTELLTKFNPDKLSDIESLLLQYKGREDVLFKKINEKYAGSVESEKNDITDIAVRERLLGLFQQYNPEKISDVDNLIEKYNGRMDVLFRKIEDKYVRKSQSVSSFPPMSTKAPINPFTPSPPPQGESTTIRSTAPSVDTPLGSLSFGPKAERTDGANNEKADTTLPIKPVFGHRDVAFGSGSKELTFKSSLGSFTSHAASPLAQQSGGFGSSSSHPPVVPFGSVSDLSSFAAFTNRPQSPTEASPSVVRPLFRAIPFPSVTQASSEPHVLDEESGNVPGAKAAAKVFDAIDTLKTGSLALDKFEEMIDTLGEGFSAGELETQVSMIDPNKTGIMSRATFIKWFVNLLADDSDGNGSSLDSEEEAERDEEEQRVKKCFMTIAGGAASIFATDFGKLFKALGSTYCEEEHRKTLKKLTGSDGTIQWEVFCEWYMGWLFGGDEEYESDDDNESTDGDDQKGKASAANGEGWGNLFGATKNTWKCDSCFVANDDNVAVCAACETPRPGFEAAVVTSTVTGGVKTSDASGSGSFSIGIAVAASSIGSGGFSFGATPATTSTTSQSSGGFSFGAPKSTASVSATTGFSFGAPSTTSSSLTAVTLEPKKVGAASQGSVSSGSFSFGPAAVVSIASIGASGFSFGTTSSSTKETTPTQGGLGSGQSDAVASGSTAAGISSATSVMTTQNTESKSCVSGGFPSISTKAPENPFSKKTPASIVASAPFVTSKPSTEQKTSTLGGYPPISSDAPKNPFSKVPEVSSVPYSHKEKLIMLFNRHNPDKVNDVDVLLEKYKGKEETLFKKISQKYVKQVECPPSTYPPIFSKAPKNPFGKPTADEGSLPKATQHSFTQAGGYVSESPSPFKNPIPVSAATLVQSSDLNESQGLSVLATIVNTATSNSLVSQHKAVKDTATSYKGSNAYQSAHVVTMKPRLSKLLTPSRGVTTYESQFLNAVEDFKSAILLLNEQQFIDTGFELKLEQFANAKNKIYTLSLEVSEEIRLIKGHAVFLLSRKSDTDRLVSETRKLIQEQSDNKQRLQVLPLNAESEAFRRRLAVHAQMVTKLIELFSNGLSLIENCCRSVNEPVDTPNGKHFVFEALKKLYDDVTIFETSSIRMVSRANNVGSSIPMSKASNTVCDVEFKIMGQPSRRRLEALPIEEPTTLQSSSGAISMAPASKWKALESRFQTFKPINMRKTKVVLTSRLYRLSTPDPIQVSSRAHACSMFLSPSKSAETRGLNIIGCGTKTLFTEPASILIRELDWDKPFQVDQQRVQNISFTASRPLKTVDASVASQEALHKYGTTLEKVAKVMDAKRRGGESPNKRPSTGPQSTFSASDQMPLATEAQSATFESSSTKFVAKKTSLSPVSSIDPNSAAIKLANYEPSSLYSQTSKQAQVLPSAKKKSSSTSGKIGVSTKPPLNDDGAPYGKNDSPAFNLAGLGDSFLTSKGTAEIPKHDAKGVIGNSIGVSVIEPSSLLGTTSTSHDFHAILKKFYQKHNPTKLGEVTKTLENYKGREVEMFSKLGKKYGVPSPLSPGANATTTEILGQPAATSSFGVATSFGSSGLSQGQVSTPFGQKPTSTSVEMSFGDDGKFSKGPSAPFGTSQPTHSQFSSSSTLTGGFGASSLFSISPAPSIGFGVKAPSQSLFGNSISGFGAMSSSPSKHFGTSPAAPVQQYGAQTQSVFGTTPSQQQQSFNGKSPREILTTFYQKQNPQKLGEIDKVLQKYQGQEEQLFRNLAKKYNLDPSVFGLSTAAIPSGGFGGPSPGFGAPSVLGSSSTFGGGATFSGTIFGSSTMGGGFGQPSTLGGVVSPVVSGSSSGGGFGAHSTANFGSLAQSPSTFGGGVQQAQPGGFGSPFGGSSFGSGGGFVAQTSPFGGPRR